MFFWIGSVRCQIKGFHEVSCYVSFVCDLESRVRMMSARSVKERSIDHDRSIFFIHVYRQAFATDLIPDHVRREVTEIVMPEVVGFESKEPRKPVFFIMVKRRRFGIGPNTALLSGRDFDPLENVNDLSSTLVRLYLARQPLLRAVLWVNRNVGFGLTRLTNSCASRNCK
jgi:hypothetical protein